MDKLVEQAWGGSATKHNLSVENQLKALHLFHERAFRNNLGEVIFFPSMKAIRRINNDSFQWGTHRQKEEKIVKRGVWVELNESQAWTEWTWRPPVVKVTWPDCDSEMFYGFGDSHENVGIKTASDMVWGSDPYFPVASPKPKFDQRAYRDGNGLVRFYPSKKFMGFGMWHEDETGVEEGWEKHTRLSDEEAERIWNTRPEAKKEKWEVIKFNPAIDEYLSKEQTMSAPKRPTKPATVPYSGGSKPEPKLEWKVEYRDRAKEGEWGDYSVGKQLMVILVVDGKEWRKEFVPWGLRPLEGRVKRCKADILRRYNLCKRESGRVDS